MLRCDVFPPTCNITIPPQMSHFHPIINQVEILIQNLNVWSLKSPCHYFRDSEIIFRLTLNIDIIHDQDNKFVL